MPTNPTIEEVKSELTEMLNIISNFDEPSSFNRGELSALKWALDKLKPRPLPVAEVIESAMGQCMGDDTDRVALIEIKYQSGHSFMTGPDFLGKLTLDAIVAEGYRITHPDNA